jgi:putative glycosyltransferase (TIGR04372 family)
MKNSLKIVALRLRNKWYVACVSGALRLEHKLAEKIGKKSANSVSMIINFLARNIPLFLHRFFPPTISIMFASVNIHYFQDSARFYSWINNVSKSKKFLKPYIHMQANFEFLKNGVNKAYFFIQNLNIRHDLEVRTYAMQWCYFNLNQKLNVELFTKIRRFHSEYKESELYSEHQVRYLPDHTAHMGHMGLLFLYGNYYRDRDKNRTVALWPHKAANSFYLKELLKQFPLNYKLMSESEPLKRIDIGLIDSIFYSRELDGSWRFEPIIAQGTGQKFPEFNISSNVLLKCDPNLSENIVDKLKVIGFDPNKWFVILHVKEERVGYKAFGEARDADINSYKLACSVVKDFGGQVIRMGSSSFPDLTTDFPAINYAHSSVKSEQIDFWLWANCKFWIGNGNGASAAVLPFGKLRIITNQWPYNPNGPIGDIIVPKLLYNQTTSTLLKFSETIESDVGGTYDKKKIENANFSLIDNTPEVISGTVNEVLEGENYFNSSDALDNEFYEATNTPSDTPRMKLSKSFKEFYELQKQKFN